MNGHEQSEECCEHGHGHGHGHGDDDGESHGHGQAHGTPLATNDSQQAGLVGSFQQSVQWSQAHDPAECEAVVHERDTCEKVRCDHSQLNSSGNVLVLVRANELIEMARINTILAIVSVFFLAVSLVCMLLNFYDCDPLLPGCFPATPPIVFHGIEFGAIFVFNTVDVFALSYSPRTLSNQYQNPIFLKLIVLLNVCISLFCLMLILINLKKFEVLAHELEYCNELTITFFNAVILIALVRGRTHAESSYSEKCFFVVILMVAGCVAAVQLAVYNLSGWTANGYSKGEKMAHYLEFTFNSISAGITFWFTMDNKLIAEKRLREIMYGDKSSMYGSLGSA